MIDAVIEKEPAKHQAADEKCCFHWDFTPVHEVNIFLDSKSRSGVARMRWTTDGSSVCERGCKTFCEAAQLALLSLFLCWF